METLMGIITTILIVSGAAFIFIGSVGLLRMPDVFLRMSASTKASTLGVGLMLLGAALFFGEISVIGRAILIFVFILATAPVSAHMLGRAAYSDNDPLWEGTRYDELRESFEHNRRVANSEAVESGD